MPTKCNRGFLLQILLLAQHVSGTTMPIIRSSRVLYSGCCLWYFVLWFSSCWSGVELRVMCPVCRMLQHPANRTHNAVWYGRSFQSTHPEDEGTTFLRKASKFLPHYPVSHPRRQSSQHLKFYCNFLILSLSSIFIPFDHILLELTHNFLILDLSFVLHILLLFNHFLLYIYLRFLDVSGLSFTQVYQSAPRRLLVHCMAIQKQMKKP